MLNKKFDLIVIGAGSGGLGAAIGMNRLGLKVLLIDRKAENIGGECLNTGCIPSKALLHVAKQIHNGRIASQFGPQLEGEVDILQVKEYIRKKQDSIRTHENAEYLREQGIEVILGTASFISNNELKVNDQTYKGRNFVVATGSKPKTIQVGGTERFPVFTNKNLFDIDFLPQNFLFIGAGPVSLEMAQAFSRLGSRVSVIVRGSRILKKEDPEIAKILLQKLEAEGIQFYFETEVEQIKDENTAVIKDRLGKESELPADALFMGLGREVDFKSLMPDYAGIKIKDEKIVLNDKLQSTNKKVFVSGDAVDNLKFSHAAEMHNMLLINNFISPLKKKLDLEHFPWVTFTDPEVATFGLNEEQLQKRKLRYERLETKLDAIDRAVTDDYEYGKLILFIEKKKFNPANAKILGGSMVAPNAGEIIQELILANVAGINLKHFMNKIYPYPTAANVHKDIVRERIMKEVKTWMKRTIFYWYRLKT